MIYDGTAWDYLPLTALRMRKALGFPKCCYKDPRLEEKRQDAIRWLRQHSSKGWIVDKVIR